MSERISRHETVDVGDVVLHALVRGAANGPVVLLIQQGPGVPMLQDADALEEYLGLEATHRVVYWDQRGTGRSLAKDATLSVSAMVDDVLAVAKAMSERLHVQSVDVVGFSLGGTLAMLAAKKDVSCIRSVSAVGPDIQMEEAEAFAWRFARDEALRRGKRGLAENITKTRDSKAISEGDRLMARVRYVSDLGGIAIGRGFFGLLLMNLLRILRSPLYTLAQGLRALQAMQRTSAALLEREDFAHLDIRDMTELRVPATIFQGRLDAAAPPFLAEQFHAALRAPKKALVWFDECAHMPYMEAPEAFRAALHTALNHGAP